MKILKKLLLLTIVINTFSYFYTKGMFKELLVPLEPLEKETAFDKIIPQIPKKHRKNLVSKIEDLPTKAKDDLGNSIENAQKTGNLDLAGITTELQIDQQKLALETIFKIINYSPQISPKIKNIDLSGNNLNTLPKQIADLENLSVLNLSDNQIEDFPNDILKLKKLEVLLLGNNKIREIPQKISSLENLKILDLSKNQVANLPAELEELNNIEAIFLNGNELKIFPPVITELTNLKALDISENKIVKLSKETLKKIKKLKNLKVIDLFGNNFNALETKEQIKEKLTHRYRIFAKKRKIPLLQRWLFFYTKIGKKYNLKTPTIITIDYLVQKFSQIEENPNMREVDIESLHKSLSEKPFPIIPLNNLKALLGWYVRKSSPRVGELKETESYVQKIKVPPGSKICIIGDIHGSIHSLLRILSDLIQKKYLSNNFKIIKKNFYIIFTGDLTDRGMYGAEVWYVSLMLKLANWNRVFLSRGNHEDWILNIYAGSGVPLGILLGFIAELYSKYTQNANTFLTTLDDKWDQLNSDPNEVYNFFPSLQNFKKVPDFSQIYHYLPMALYLGSGKDKNISWVQFSHGAIKKDYDPSGILDSKENIRIVPFDNKEALTQNSFTWGDFFWNPNDELFKIDTRNGREEDINLTEKYKPLKAFFRGHQHYDFGLKMFPKEETIYENLGKEAKEYYNPINWKEVVSKEEKRTKKIKIADHVPVFTFSTATELGLVPHTFYGILTTAEKYEDWILEPNIIQLPAEYRKKEEEESEEEIEEPEEEEEVISYSTMIPEEEEEKKELLKKRKKKKFWKKKKKRKVKPKKKEAAEVISYSAFTIPEEEEN